MEQIKNEQTEPITQPVKTEEAEGGKEGEVSLGKFKDVDALLNAYNSLQSEFTKRCQKIKELESKMGTGDKTEVPPQSQEENSADGDTTSKDDVLREYLLDVMKKKSKAIVMDGAGVGVKTPVSRPKTFEEAGSLAKQMFNKIQ